MDLRLVLAAILCGVFGLAVSVGNCDSSGSITVSMNIASVESISLPSGTISLGPPSGNDYAGTAGVTFSTTNANGCTLSAYDSGKMLHNSIALTNYLTIEFPTESNYQNLLGEGISPGASSGIYNVGQTIGTIGLLQTIIPYDPVANTGDPAGDYSDTVYVTVTPQA